MRRVRTRRRSEAKQLELGMRRNDTGFGMRTRRREGRRRFGQGRFEQEEGDSDKKPISGYEGRKDTQADQPLGRHILWKEARVNKEGVVDNENVKKVVELCETIEQSSETQEGNKDTCRDILGKVFNVPEYSGRVRGKGFGVTPKSFFPQEKRQKPSNEEVLEKLRILSEQVALLVNTNKDKQLPVQLQPEIQMESETGSCNVGLKSIPELVLSREYVTTIPRKGNVIQKNTQRWSNESETLKSIHLPVENCLMIYGTFFSTRW
ncbi:uncharacterized protein [Cicer arietinum]|uniref:uncharacterized protein n=1 Tax=Cicer arietinum TaxID=3827 RepID=UPI003CC5A60E